MSHATANAAEDILAYLDTHEKKSLLRFITCGAVDDGKSTLIGRLLYDTKLVYEDQLAALQSDSKKFGTQGERIDFALLVDGLAAEREQGITIDVAYRFFSTEKRKFIVADTPGHEQYTRNMATGASTADLAVILIDARQGVLTQTRRHSYICSLLGIRSDRRRRQQDGHRRLREGRFDRIEAAYRAFAEPLGFSSIVCLPISALEGDNILAKSANTPWHKGPALLPYLETVEVASDSGEALPTAGAMGQSSQSRLSRVLRHHRLGRRRRRRRNHRASVSRAKPRQVDRQRGRRIRSSPASHRR